MLQLMIPFKVLSYILFTPLISYVKKYRAGFITL